MHIQDGYLSTPVCLATGALALGAVSYSLHKLKDSLADRTIPLTGMMASLVFAGQMVNFPIGLPVSGHLLGGVLAAAVLGPWAGCIAITLVLVVQWALFSDGGLTALGANVLHMGVIGSMGGYAIYAVIRRFDSGFRGTVIGAVIAAWLSVLAAAALFCFEFRLSYSASDFQFSNVFSLMVTLHALIGVGEALITGTIISLIHQQRPDLLYSPTTKSTPRAVGRFLVAGLMAALAVGAFVAPFASEMPDGLDAVAERFRIAASDSATAGLFEDYDKVPAPLAGWQSVSVSIAGIGGTLIVFVTALALGRLRPGQRPVTEPVGESG